MNADLAILGAPNFLWDALNALKTCTKAYTFFNCWKNKSLLSITYGSIAPLKIEFCKECPFESDRGHHHRPHHRTKIIFTILAVVDDYTRENLSLVVESSLSGAHGSPQLAPALAGRRVVGLADR